MNPLIHLLYHSQIALLSLTRLTLNPFYSFLPSLDEGLQMADLITKLCFKIFL
jgi:hypothetical protein